MKKCMNKQFMKDYKRMTGKNFSYNPSFFLTFLFRYQVRYAFYYRAYQKRKCILLRILMYRITRKYGLEISPDSQIGEGLYLGHPFNITVGSNAKLGKMVSLHKGCTIGEVNGGKKRGSPHIGNKVYIGINATVVGNITIGDDVMICANTFVDFDVPSHSIVINTGSIHSKVNATEFYISDT